ncbi:winged helix-turn-helix domain-containing protein [Photobacterium frigidiphilum]|uniref:winged helix-turn-helix domain-containing protein n=1 Tax=Photobacterium frigidiphilum TaxID=264736 RepID=UPI003D0F67C5
MDTKRYKIDNWIFIPSENKCILDERSIVIDNRLSNLLLFLCQHPHQTFSRDELINEVWNGSFLTDQVITQSIFELRKILKSNQRHPHGYIITIPKRGYKFDAEVEIQDENLSTNTNSDNNEHAHALLNTAHTNREAVREVPQPSSAPSYQKEREATHQRRSSRGKLIAFCCLLLVATLASLFYYVKIPESNATSTRNFNSLEPSVINVSIKIDSNTADPKTTSIEIGVINSLLNDLQYNKNFRLVRNTALSPVAGKSLTFHLLEENGKKYIDVEYYNNISNFMHLDRKYLINENNLLPTTKQMLTNLLHALHINVPQQTIDSALSEMPTNPQALALTMQAIGIVFNKNDADKLNALALYQQALDIEPDNHYLIAMNYIYKMTLLYISNSGIDNDKKEVLNNALMIQKDMLLSYPQSNKVHEAFALLALTTNNTVEAQQHLEKIHYNQQTVMTLLLNAKLAETFGNTASASEYYYQALHKSGSARVFEVAETLVFYSDLSSIKKKLGLQL